MSSESGHRSYKDWRHKLLAALVNSHRETVGLVANYLVNSEKLFVLCLAFVVLSVLGLNWLQAFFVFPIPVGDAEHWLPPIVNNLSGRGFINQFSPSPTFHTAEDGPFSLAGYPLLFQGVASSVSLSDDIVGVYLGLSIVKGLALVLFLASCLLLLARRKPGLTTPHLILLVSCLLTFNVLSQWGRPEIIVVFVLSVAILQVVVERRVRAFAAGCYLGLIGAANPMCGLLAGALLVPIYSFLWGGKRLIGKLAITAVVSVSVFVLVLALYRDVAESFLILFRESDSQFGYWFDLDRFIWHNFFIKWTFMLGFAVFYSLLLILLVPFYRMPKSWLGYTLGSMGFLAVYFVAAVARPEPVYNIHAMIPVGMAVAVWLAAEDRLRSSSTAVFFVSSAGFFFGHVLFLFYLIAGINYYDAGRAFNAVLERWPEEGWLAVGSGLWALEADPDRYTRYYDWDRADGSFAERNTGSLLLLQQINDGRFVGYSTIPPKRIVDEKLGLDHTLVCDYYNHAVPAIFGVRLGPAYPGYGFAVYVPHEFEMFGQAMKCVPNSTGGS